MTRAETAMRWQWYKAAAGYFGHLAHVACVSSDPLLKDLVRAAAHFGLLAIKLGGVDGL